MNKLFKVVLPFIALLLVSFTNKPTEQEEVIKINEQKIKALQDENDLLKSKLEGIQEEIKLNDQKIQHKKSVFEKTILKIQEWINNDLTQLKSLKK